MITAILEILASITGLIGAWALMKFVIAPWYQKVQNIVDTAENNAAKQAASDANQAANNQDAIDQKNRDDALDKLNPKP